ncbi:MAG: lipid IV(A) palmitoyltransferase PagP [Legionella longbeachae]|nr:lipid IV(A) palmitoyltransferase PagP [Legionella longbeachae]
MKKIISLLIVFSFNAFSNPSTIAHPPSSNDLNKSPIRIEKSNDCKYWLPIFKPFCHRLHQIWTEGNNELYLSGYAWHNRFTYSSERMRERKYNELAWGGGFGKGFFDEKGNWHGLYAFAFLDSHRKVEPTAGYAYLKVAHLSKNFKAGLGFSILVTARPDILHYIPFPGAVPWAGVFYKKVSIKAAYIPGSSTNGNVLYVVGTYTFD